METVKVDISMAPDIAGLEKLCFPAPWSLSMVKEELRNPRSYFLAAVENGVLLGYIGVQTVLDEGYISNVAVSPSARRRGIATTLIDRMKEYGREKKLAFLTLEVRLGNTGAIALYEKNGFTRVGVRKNYYEMPREDAVLMTYFY